VCDASYAKNKGNQAHLDTLEIGEIVQNSKVKKVVLTHFYPSTKDIDLISEVKEKYSGEVICGEDLMVINL
jgi:ribonuclease BN (tRNA processing enzyme)